MGSFSLRSKEVQIQLVGPFFKFARHFSKHPESQNCELCSKVRVLQLDQEKEKKKSRKFSCYARIRPLELKIVALDPIFKLVGPEPFCLNIISKV